MEELFVDELKDLYSAEKQIAKSLPKLAKAATSPELKEAFESQLQETLGQIERLDQVFDLMSKPHKGEALPWHARRAGGRLRGAGGCREG